MTDDDLQSRTAALALLDGVIRKRLALDGQLDGSPAFTKLGPRDRGFAHNLVATTLRRLGQIDALIATFVDRPLAKNANHITDILRLGVAQLYFTGVASHAAVDTSVRLARQARRGQFDKLVNAVLRRAQREGESIIASQDAPRLNTPDWLWQSWEQAYGLEICRKIAEGHMTPAPLDLSVKSNPEDWVKALGGGLIGAETIRLTESPKVADLPGYSEGAWWVQDAAAALPVRMLGDVMGHRVLDVCAAPGGKTAQLAAAGAQVTALDRSAARMGRLTENLARLNLNAETITADAVAWTPETQFDAILLDAPCSATGTIRRHPDLPHLKSKSDVASLADVQGRLIARAADWLRPGGRLVFATCSLQPEEGPAQVTSFLAARPNFKRNISLLDPLKKVLPTKDLIDSSGDLRCLPCHLREFGGMDGFYAALLEKSA